jgi:hypothetical protein
MSPREEEKRGGNFNSNKQVGEKTSNKNNVLDRDLKSCMKCKFFWGNNHMCATNSCYKEKRSQYSRTMIRKVNAMVVLIGSRKELNKKKINGTRYSEQSMN